jgi:hypothetical protein
LVATKENLVNWRLEIFNKRIRIRSRP